MENIIYPYFSRKYLHCTSSLRWNKKILSSTRTRGTMSNYFPCRHFKSYNHLPNALSTRVAFLPPCGRRYGFPEIMTLGGVIMSLVSPVGNWSWNAVRKSSWLLLDVTARNNFLPKAAASATFFFLSCAVFAWRILFSTSLSFCLPVYLAVGLWRNDRSEKGKYIQRDIENISIHPYLEMTDRRRGNTHTHWKYIHTYVRTKINTCVHTCTDGKTNGWKGYSNVTSNAL